MLLLLQLKFPFRQPSLFGWLLRVEQIRAMADRADG